MSGKNAIGKWMKMLEVIDTVERAVPGAGKVAQLLGALAALPGRDLGLNPSNHMATHNLL